MRGHPGNNWGRFLRTLPYLPHVKEPVTKGHLSCRDTLSGILRCPLKTGYTVRYILSNLHAVWRLRLYCIHSI